MIVSGEHNFDASGQEWGRRELFPAIRIKGLESRATHPGESIMPVQAAGGRATMPPGTPHCPRNTGDVALELSAIHRPPVR